MKDERQRNKLPLFFRPFARFVYFLLFVVVSYRIPLLPEWSPMDELPCALLAAPGVALDQHTPA